MSSGSDIRVALHQLQDLCESINRWTEDVLPHALYRAPIIDWHHPDDYTQKGITGLRKFQSTAEAERDHVAGLVNSALPPKEFNSNAPHLVAVWHEFLRASWPLAGISQTLEVGTKVPVKVDVIGRGGAEWIKINTIKESRLLAEFREQDSYINSDYDSETSSPGAGPSKHSIPAFTNSLVAQGGALLHVAEIYPRPSGHPPPKIRMILTRLIRADAEFSDDRVDQTISHLEHLGIIVQLGPSSKPILTPTSPTHLHPTKNIVLDLSVLVALCCDSTHHPLPTSPQGFESRFRSLRVDETSGDVDLGEHTNTSKDLQDQLQWEAQHPLVQEMKDRSGAISADGGRDLVYWITEEVRDRLPGLVDIIGGPSEQRRGRALLRSEGEVSDFWKGSRWEGNEGVLRDLRVRILPPSADIPDSSPSAFQLALASTCRTLLWTFDNPPPPESIPNGKRKPPRRSKLRPSAVFPPNRAPSGHTIRTMVAGAERGWTVLSNNRGAVGKVGREMGIGEGLCWSSISHPTPTHIQPSCPSHDPSNGDMEEVGKGSNELGGQVEEAAAVWVVNPSSLSEWRRLEVLRENEKVKRA